MSYVSRIAKKHIRRFLYQSSPPELVVFLRHHRSKAAGAFAGRNVYVEKSLPSDRVLVLAAHPDDEAIGMGGALSLYRDNRSDLTILYMTDGRGLGSSPEDMIRIRRKEAESLGKEYQIRQIFWDIQDCSLKNDPATVSRLTKLLEELRPSTVYLPSFFEHHYDHFMANQVLADAIEMTPSAAPVVIGYEVWDNIPFPNYIVDISKSFDTKREILGHYQKPLEDTDYVLLSQSRNFLHYFLYIDTRRKAAGYAEAFIRLDAENYRRAYRDYVSLLRESGSQLLDRVNASMPVGQMK